MNCCKNPGRRWFVLTAAFAVALTVKAAQEGPYTYTVDGGSATITDFDATYAGTLNITNSLGGVPVAHIGTWAFSHCESLTGVTVPSGVTSIGDNAFWSCDILDSVTLPDSVVTVGDSALRFCGNLSSITLGSGVTNIGSWAFSSCESLGGVTIPDSITSIGEWAFSYCASLVNVSISSNVLFIGDQAFHECTNLVGITVAAANSSYSSLDDVLFNKSQSVLLQYPAGKAGPYSVPNSVTAISDLSFWMCTGLTSISIPGNVSSIGDNVFTYCSGLTNIAVDEANSTYCSTGGVLFTEGKLFLLQYPGGMGGHYSIPRGVVYIRTDAFRACEMLTGVTIPSSVTTIQPTAFQECVGLTRLTVPNSVTLIQTGAFRYSGLITITVGNGVSSVPTWAFQGCADLKRVYFTGNKPSVGTDVFLNAGSPTVFYLPGTTGWSSTFAGRPAVLWNPSFSASSATQTGVIFAVTGTTDIPICLEACTNLGNAAWVQIETTNLVAGGYTFLASHATNYSGRFYRVSGP